MESAPLRQEEQLVLFRLAGETYGVSITRVQEIVRARDITRVPGSRMHMCGVLNLRGSIVPVLDLRARLGLPGAQSGPDARIIIAESDGGTVGMIVDSVSQVARIPSEQIECPPEIVADAESGPIAGLGRVAGSLVILLDVDRTLAAAA